MTDTPMTHAPEAGADRDAILEGLQDQVDELSAAIEAQQAGLDSQQIQLDALNRLATLLARRAGLSGLLRTRR